MTPVCLSYFSWVVYDVLLIKTKLELSVVGMFVLILTDTESMRIDFELCFVWTRIDFRAIRFIYPFCMLLSRDFEFS